MSLNALTILASESNEAPAIHPYLVGGITLVIPATTAADGRPSRM